MSKLNKLKAIDEIYQAHPEITNHPGFQALGMFFKENKIKIDVNFITKTDNNGRRNIIQYQELCDDFILWLDQNYKLFTKEVYQFLLKKDNFKVIIRKFYKLSKLLVHKSVANGMSQPVKKFEWDEFQARTQFEDLDLIVLKAWMWAVKKSAIFNQRVPQTLPFILINSRVQGSQKSSFVNWLLEPLAGLTATIKGSSLLDRFGQAELIGKNAVLFLDEMTHLDHHSAISLLKFILTNDTHFARTMFSEIQAPITRLSQFIGTSQFRINELIKDATGNRRYYNITLKTPLKKWLDYCDYNPQDDNKFENGTCQRMWNSIDINKIPEFFNAENQIKFDLNNITENKVYSKYEIWWEERGKTFTVNEFYRTETLFASYRDHRKEIYGRKPSVNKIHFSRQIKNTLCEFLEKTRKGAGSMRGFLVIDNHLEIPEEKEVYTQYQRVADLKNELKRIQSKKKQLKEPEKKPEEIEINWN